MQVKVFKFYPSVLLLTIQISQSGREKLDSYFKIPIDAIFYTIDPENYQGKLTFRKSQWMLLWVFIMTSSPHGRPFHRFSGGFPETVSSIHTNREKFEWYLMPRHYMMEFLGQLNRGPDVTNSLHDVLRTEVQTRTHRTCSRHTIYCVCSFRWKCLPRTLTPSVSYGGKPPEEYQMVSHIFGAKDSLSCANYCRAANNCRSSDIGRPKSACPTKFQMWSDMMSGQIFLS